MSSNDETKRNANAKAREKNAQVHQDWDYAAKIVHSQFDNIGLTSEMPTTCLNLIRHWGRPSCRLIKRTRPFKQWSKSCWKGRSPAKQRVICGGQLIKKLKIPFTHLHGR